MLGDYSKNPVKVNGNADIIARNRNKVVGGSYN